MDWYYLRLKLHVDPILEDIHKDKYSSISIDLLTWRFIITKSLNELYGISGESRHYDILVKQTQKPAIETVLRIQAADAEIFKNSFSNFSGSLSDYIGQEYEYGFFVQVIDESPFLGALSDEKLIGTN